MLRQRHNLPTLLIHKRRPQRCQIPPSTNHLRRHDDSTPHRRRPEIRDAQGVRYPRKLPVSLAGEGREGASSGEVGNGGSASPVEVSETVGEGGGYEKAEGCCGERRDGAGWASGVGAWSCGVGGVVGCGDRGEGVGEEA